MTEWQDAEIKTPITGKKYLTYDCMSDEIETYSLFKHENGELFWALESEWPVYHYDGGGITHWMELPEAPYD